MLNIGEKSRHDKMANRTMEPRNFAKASEETKVERTGMSEKTQYQRTFRADDKMSWNKAILANARARDHSTKG